MSSFKSSVHVTLSAISVQTRRASGSVAAVPDSHAQPAQPLLEPCVLRPAGHLKTAFPVLTQGRGPHTLGDFPPLHFSWRAGRPRRTGQSALKHALGGLDTGIPGGALGDGAAASLRVQGAGRVPTSSFFLTSRANHIFPTSRDCWVHQTGETSHTLVWRSCGLGSVDAEASTSTGAGWPQAPRVTAVAACCVV